MLKRLAYVITVFVSLLILGAPPHSVSAASNDRIVYMTDSGPTEIVSRKIDGTDRHVLGYGFSPIASPDGSKVAFIRYEPDTRLTNVYVVNMDGSNLTLVGSNINPNNGDAPINIPTWSPDSSRLAFMRLFSRFPMSANIYTVNPDGSNEVNITQNLGNGNFKPVWSPTGNKIMFTRNINNLVGLYTMDPDGSNVQQVVSQVGDGIWSPDATKIAYVAFLEQSSTSAVTVANADGSNPVHISGPPTVYAYSPSWSPDSSYIAFLSSCNCSGSPTTLEVVHPDGTGQRTLVNPPLGAGIDYPGWSADSSLVLSTSPTTSHGVAVTPIAGGATQTLFNDASGLLLPQWVTGPRSVLAAPTGLTASTPAQTPALHWNSVTGANQYKIYRDGSLLASTSTATYNDSTATEGNHTYYVIASDTTGAQDDSLPSATITVLVDKSGPVITISKTPPANPAGWNNSNVLVSFSCSDSLSGVQSCPAQVTISTEGANQTISRSATDNAGNTSTASTTISIDKTVPTVSNPTTSSFIVFPGSTITLSANASDSLSGVAKGEYYIDNDPGPGNGSAMSYVSGKISSSATLNNLTLGWHRIYMRSQDKAGNWSTVISVMVFYI